MPQFIANGPLWGIVVFLFFVVFHRAQATYGLGRLVAAGWLRQKSNNRWLVAIQKWFAGPVPKRGEQALEKWGVIIIPLCFLTVGFQTAVNAGAGIVRMRWLTYTLCMIPGCIAWALMYGIFGLSLWWVALQVSMSHPPVAITIFVLLTAGITWFLIRRGRLARAH